MKKEEKIICGWRGDSYLLGNEYVRQPFIWITYKSYGKKKMGKMMIDTGATDNYLSDEHVSELTIAPLGNSYEWTESMFKCVKSRRTAMSFSMGGVHIHTSFLVIAPEDDTKETDERVIGSLGMDFLIRYGFILDFEKGVLRRNRNKSPYWKPRDCEFVFDIRRDLHYSRIPLISCFINGKNYNCLVDSGGLNVIHRKAMEESGVESIDMDEDSTFNGVGYEANASIWKLKLNFCTYKDTKTDFTSFSIAQDFLVVDDTDKLHCDNPNQINLGYEFLWRDEWIIDAWAGKIYRHNRLQNFEAEFELRCFEKVSTQRLLEKWPSKH